MSLPSVLVLSRLRRCSCSRIESLDAVFDDPFDDEHRFAEHEHRFAEHEHRFAEHEHGEVRRVPESCMLIYGRARSGLLRDSGCRPIPIDISHA